MRRFNSIGTWYFRGQPVYTVLLDREEEREGLLGRLQDEGVIVDGKEIRIDGVESFAVDPLRKGTQIGLRVAR